MIEIDYHIINDSNYQNRQIGKGRGVKMKLPEGQKGIIYTIKSINGDEEINKFLFTLGCFEGETISIVKKMYSNLIINIKGGRYGIDKDLAEVIEIF